MEGSMFMIRKLLVLALLATLLLTHVTRADETNAKDWIIVSMNDDWNTVFPLTK